MPVIELRMASTRHLRLALALPRAGAVFVSDGEFVGAAREVIFAQARSHTETNDLLM